MVTRIGGRLAVEIPRVVAAEARLADGAPLDVSHTAAGILFRPAGRRPRRSIAAVARQIDPAGYARRTAELSPDPTVGLEVG